MQQHDQNSIVGQPVTAHAEVFPPVGFVDRYEAARRLGVQVAALHKWVRQGRFGYAGVLAMGPNGVRCRIYAIDELEKARGAMALRDAEGARLPEGFVDFAGAAAFFGIFKSTLTQWQQRGLVDRGTWMSRPDGKWQRIYAIVDLEQAKQRMQAEAQQPAAPEGFIDVREAAQLLGVNKKRLREWEIAGRLEEGQIIVNPATNGRIKIYPLARIEQLRAEREQAAKASPPPGWVTMEEAAQRANVSLLVWKNWLAEGRIESGQWFIRPKMPRRKLFRVEEIDQLVTELGEEHLLFMQPDGNGGYMPPTGYVDRVTAASMLDVSEETLRYMQQKRKITCGRWARMPIGRGISECGWRRIYPLEQIKELVEVFDKIGKAYIDPNDSSIARVPIMGWSKAPSEAIIDAADLPLIEGMRWNLMERSDHEGAMVARSGRSGEQTPLRQILLGLRGRQHHITHRNGDPLDCRRTNIVVRNQSETNAHARKRKSVGGIPCSSRFKGVSWYEGKGKWVAEIRKDGERRRLGSFDDEIAAAQAYDEALKELFGEHARPNFPDGVDEYLQQQYEQEKKTENHREAA